MSKIINVGRVTSYADAVKGGYTGTREDWERDLAALGTTAAEVEANRQAVAEDKAAVEENLTTVESYKNSAAQSASEALQSAESAHTDALAATAAKEAAQTAQDIAEEARADAVSAKGAAESAQTEANASASAATEAALAAGNAAQTATTQAGAASDSATAAAASAASVSGVVQEVTAAKAEAITAIEAKGAETLDSIPDDYTVLSGDVDDLKDTIEFYEPANEIVTLLNTAGNTYTRFIRSSTNQWASTTNGCSIFKIPETAQKVRITANTTNSCGIAFLTTNNRVVNTTPDYATGWDAVKWNAAGSENEYNIPADAVYLYVAKNYQSNNYTPEKVESVAIFDAKDATEKQNNILDKLTMLPLGLHEMPTSESVLNIIKRCRQMTDIEWIPAVDLPRLMLVQRSGTIPDTATVQEYLGMFKAGVKYRGIPYGRVSETMDTYGIEYGTVGNYIEFDTFISSVSNPKSKLCIENISDLSKHKTLIYATVCSGMVCYALNVSERPTATITGISGLNLIGKLNNNGTPLADNLIQIGDILNLSGYHAAIITDIIRDMEGAIQSVELSDASPAGLADRTYSDGQIGGVCRRKGWTREQLYDKSNSSSWGNYSVYRYNNEVPYTPNPYVNVGDESDSWRIEHFPIMPYEGENFRYKTGYIPQHNGTASIRLVITLDGYSYVKVFKEGAEIEGSPFGVTKSGDTINPIDITEIGIGKYTAYLCNITNGNVVNITYPCEWTISE